MKRTAPRPLRAAFEEALGSSAPPGLLASVQAVWPEVAGKTLAAEAEPISEGDGVVTVSCRSSVWAQELELLGSDLEKRLNQRLAPGRQVAGLRFRSGPAGKP